MDIHMTENEKAQHFETLKHIKEVARLLGYMSIELTERGMHHDQTKLEEPEVHIFAEFTPKLFGLTYGSEEYKATLKEMSPAIKHHHGCNRHHPEYFAEEAKRKGLASPVDCMTLVDLVEMLCDWKAATLRHEDGDIVKSIDINRERFGISDQLASILRNTATQVF